MGVDVLILSFFKNLKAKWFWEWLCWGLKLILAFCFEGTLLIFCLFIKMGKCQKLEELNIIKIQILSQCLCEGLPEFNLDAPHSSHASCSAQDNHQQLTVCPSSRASRQTRNRLERRATLPECWVEPLICMFERGNDRNALKAPWRLC